MRLAILFLASSLAIAPAHGRPSSRSSTSASHPSTRAKSSGASSSRARSTPQVHVRSYTRKDGTTVTSHRRSYPQRATPHASPSTGVSRLSPSHESARNKCASCARDSHGRIQRSSIAKHQFERSHPCPSTGKTAGACPGYVVDHVKPLKRGGADALSNMQWQTKEAARAKDKVE
jgi:hypothetical protein